MVDFYKHQKMTTLQIAWVRLMHKLGFTIQMAVRGDRELAWEDWPNPKWNYHMCVYRVKK